MRSHQGTQTKNRAQAIHNKVFEYLLAKMMMNTHPRKEDKMQNEIVTCMGVAGGNKRREALSTRRKKMQNAHRNLQGALVAGW